MTVINSGYFPGMANLTFEGYLEMLDQAIRTYGEEAQLRMLQEEAAEVIQAVNHLLRRPDEDEDLLQLKREMADLQVVLDQARLIIERRSTGDMPSFEIVLEDAYLDLQDRLNESAAISEIDVGDILGKEGSA